MRGETGLKQLRMRASRHHDSQAGIVPGQGAGIANDVVFRQRMREPVPAVGGRQQRHGRIRHDGHGTFGPQAIQRQSYRQQKLRYCCIGMTKDRSGGTPCEGAFRTAGGKAGAVYTFCENRL
jgi:hypothetical protein